MTLSISGEKFGKLTAIQRATNAKRSSWVCRCECGKSVIVQTSNLTGGNSKSCGCLTPDIARGWNKTPEYTAFRNAKNRCERPADVRFSQYGGRGILFLFQNMDDFIAAIGPRPSPDHSLDRINSDGHYEAGNVRWATKKQQARNKTSNRFVEYRGKKMPLKAACELSGTPYKRAFERIVYLGWPIERALS